MAAFVFKVFTLTIRTIAKPLSKRVEAYVLDHPTLRKPVVNLAQVRDCVSPYRQLLARGQAS